MSPVCQIWCLSFCFEDAGHSMACFRDGKLPRAYVPPRKLKSTFDKNDGRSR